MFRFVLVLSLLAGLTGCPTGSSCREGTRPDEAGSCVPADAGPPTDAGPPADGGPDDAGTPPDVPVDAPTCVPRTLFVDADGDGFGRADVTMLLCGAPEGYATEAGDCDDARDDVSPIADEICDMAMVDEDCDGARNVGCECWVGQTRPCPGASDVGECAAGTQRCGSDGRWLATCEGTVLAAAERCDGLDNDCDMVVDGTAADGTCPTWPNGSPRCLATGTCGGICSAGYADCGAEPGCEARLGTRSTCGACGDSCSFLCVGAAGGCRSVDTVEVGWDISHTACAISDAGTLYCWGDNASGEIPGATESSVLRPVAVTGLPSRPVLDVAVGFDHVCAIVASTSTAPSGSVYCWGGNGDGQLGDGTTTARATPTLVTAFSSATEIAAGYASSCAVIAGGAVRCWGRNLLGQLGDGTNVSRPRPVAVGTLSNVRSLEGSEHRYCVITPAGAVACWGLGVSSPATTTLAGRTVTRLAVGSAHACVVSAGAGADQVHCWGDNAYGQLGDGTTIARTTPTLVSSFGAALRPVEITAGSGFSCAVTLAGSVHCWGENTWGQLGDGTITNRSRPTPLSGSVDAVGVAAGRGMACASTAAGALWCWGANFSGSLGDGTRDNRAAPVSSGGL